MSHPAIDRSVLLIGGTDAGKSNFLFRVWIAIDEGRGLLAKNGLPKEFEYLRAGAEELLRGKFAGHTSKEVQERVVVPLRSTRPDGPTGTVVVPDMPGEQTLTICRRREWSADWEDHISSGCACLLFVRAGSDEVVAPLDWAACFALYGAPAVAPPTDAEEVNPATVPPQPTQVVLVEWLQFLRRAFTAVAGGAFRPRVGIVVSAWDAVPTDQQEAGPASYIRDNFPMLNQFLEAHADRFDFRVFGVSVVAGAYSAPLEH